MQMLQQIVALFLISMVASSVAQRYDYDTVKLVLQWPIAYCNGLRNGRTIDCKSPVPHTFTIHGLWYFKVCEPPYPRLEPNILTNLWTQLSQAWPNLDGDDFQFWSYEWEKHGWCYHVGDPAKYFQTALELYSRYATDTHALAQTTGSLLSKHNGYTPQEIVGIITKVTQLIPELRCSIDRHGRNQLQEIVLCFYPEGTEYIRKDCWNNKFSRCPTNDIIFPSAQIFDSPDGPKVDPVRNHAHHYKKNGLWLHVLITIATIISNFQNILFLKKKPTGQEVDTALNQSEESEHF